MQFVKVHAQTNIVFLYINQFQITNLIMKYVAENMASKVATNSQAAFNNASSNIDWNDFNYPPCLKIFHYSGDEVPEVHSSRVLLWKINHILIIIATFLNFITNIAATAQGHPQGGIRIGISIFLFLFWLPVSLYLFILPYEILMKGDGKAFIFYILSLLAFIFFGIWCIANFADANGFVMVSQNFNANRAAAGVLGIFVAVIQLVITILTVFNLYRFYTR